MEENKKNPNIKKRHVYGYRGRTNFYPLYDSENDQVEPIQPISEVMFQKVLPHYEISTTETRDSGLGPMFDGEPQIVSPDRKEKKADEENKKENLAKNPYKGNILDVEA